MQAETQSNPPISTLNPPPVFFSTHLNPKTNYGRVVSKAKCLLQSPWPIHRLPHLGSSSKTCGSGFFGPPLEKRICGCQNSNFEIGFLCPAWPCFLGTWGNNPRPQGPILDQENELQVMSSTPLQASCQQKPLKQPHLNPKPSSCIFHHTPEP